MTFRLIDFRIGNDDRPRAGLKVGEGVVDIGNALSGSGYDTSSTVALIEHWTDALPRLEALAASGRASLGLDDVSLAAPLLHPSNIFCAGANYSDHFKEMSGKEPDKSAINPYFFNKVARQTIIGPRAIRPSARSSSRRGSSACCQVT